jgi:hypothetical protein
MRPLVLIAYVLAATAVAVPSTHATPAKESTATHSTVSNVTPTSPTSGSSSAGGRYQLVVVPGHDGSPFLLDSTSGCLWQQVHNQETKRTTFVEVDVENLHWSWGSGAQQVLAARVDAATAPDDQKRILKESLQKTGCGLSNVVLTPGPRQGGAAPVK